MDQPMAGKKTFFLKINIPSCDKCEKKLKKILRNISGVDKVSIDAEQGRTKISGNMDPEEVMKSLRKELKNTKISWEPVVAQYDFEMSRNHQHLIHDKDVEQLKKLSEIKGLKTVEISRNGMKITFKEDANVQDLGGKNDYSAATSLDQQRAMHRKYYHYCCCSRNQAMGSRGNISLGIPVQDYYPPSAPPVSEKDYPNPPPQQEQYSYPRYPFYTENDYPNPPPQQEQYSYPRYPFFTENDYPNPPPQQEQYSYPRYPFFTENDYPNPPPQQEKSYPGYPFFTENGYPNPPPQQEKSYLDYIMDYVFGCVWL